MEFGELFEQAIEEWRISKGIGTAFVPTKLNDKILILGILQGIYSRSPTCNTLIIVETFNDRTDLVEFLTHQPNSEENNKEFKKLLDDKHIRVYTYNFVNKSSFNFNPLLCILYRNSLLTDNVKRIFENTRFKLAVINKHLETSEQTVALYKNAPLLSCFNHEEIRIARMSTPVEECCVGVTFDDTTEDSKLINYYDDYITTSINIFGSFEKIYEARNGNKTLNISSAKVCSQLARDNGWNEHLDMSVPYNVQLDTLYNPISIKNRAVNTYEYIRNRQELLASNSVKLKVIFDYVNNNKDKKILIISKQAKFAKLITDYLNDMSETNICGDYHDFVEPIPAVDVEGNPIYIKSGVHKGERKFISAMAQKTLNKKLFNLGKLRVLSANCSPDKDLDVKIDNILISSPYCLNSKEYIYRLDKLILPQTLSVQVLYMIGTHEEKAIRDREISNTFSNVKSVNNDDGTNICSNFIIDD